MDSPSTAATTTAATDRLDVWRDLIRDNFVALDIHADRHADFAGSVRCGGLGHLKVASVSSEPQGCSRTPGLARRDDDVYLQVGLIAAGGARVTQDGREAVLHPGDFAVYETDRPFHWGLHGEWELLVFTWPRASIALDPAASQQLTARRLSGGTGLGAIVGRVLRDLVAGPPELSPAGGVRLASEVAELVATVAGEQVRPAEPTRSADDLLRRIDAYIVEHLADPDLGPAGIAAAHFVSTRHLHRLFAHRGGTVSQQIQRLRLERCRRDLFDPRSAARSITDVSRRWGFADLATFSRAFRAAYGMSPSDWRAGRPG
ncbi:helix-turn-helix domain-containing protein [Pseudonocardia petroleophila]|uniref:Helix-turn-helix domain-containing protein n=1 Tax=Pseudonocardia petroleophila TaxID=37331 RepID=A0A7G7MAM9_9PSEU|nr:helix-turn-helix domain-containing protein [Pseudonocardia petroleophila]QNG49840.1 helix-turn-helix domain-containing protein [Pseudonocardia petroleophila]